MKHAWFARAVAVAILASTIVAAQQTGRDGAGSAPSTKSESRRPLRVRVSEGVARALLVKKVEPEYPGDVHVQGSVVLKALIDSNGNVENLTVVSGHPMLIPAAIKAVKQWRYKPYIFNGEYAEMETWITVSFQPPAK